MGLLNVIRKLRLRQGLAIREIERRTGLSRNTIKKYLKADGIEPKFATPERSSKLDPFAEKLTGWLPPALRPKPRRRVSDVELQLLTRELQAMLKAGVPFRNDIVTGPGGKQILCLDPSGNVVELFEAASVPPKPRT